MKIPEIELSVSVSLWICFFYDSNVFEFHINTWIPTLARFWLATSTRSCFSFWVNVKIFIYCDLPPQTFVISKFTSTKCLNFMCNFRKTSWRRYPKFSLTSLTLVSLVILLQLMFVIFFFLLYYSLFSNFPGFWKTCFKFFKFLLSRKCHCYKITLSIRSC